MLVPLWTDLQPPRVGCFGAFSGALWSASPPRWIPKRLAAAPPLLPLGRLPAVKSIETFREH